MNKARRKAIEHVRAALEAERAMLEEIRDQEQEYRDAMPAGIGEGEKGDKADGVIEQLSSVLQTMEEIDEALNPREFE